MSILPTNMNIGASSNFLSGNLGASNINHSGDFPTVVTSTNQHGYTLPKSTFNMSGYALNSTWDQKTLRLASFSKWPLTILNMSSKSVFIYCPENNQKMLSNK